MKKLMTTAAALLFVSSTAMAGIVDETGNAVDISDLNTNTGINLPEETFEIPDIDDVMDIMLSDFTATQYCDYMITVEGMDEEQDACALSEKIDYIVNEYPYEFTVSTDEITQWDELIAFATAFANLTESAIIANDEGEGGVEEEDFRDYLEEKDDFVDRNRGYLVDEDVYDKYRSEAMTFEAFFDEIHAAIKLKARSVAGSTIVLNGIEALQTIE